MDELSVLHPFSLRKAPGFSGVCFPSLRPCLSGRDRFPRKSVETGKVGLAIRAPFQFVARCSFVLGLCAATMSAQPVPKLTSVSPEWIERGTTSVVTLEGENLSEVTGFIFSGEGGLTATNAPPPAYSANLESSRGGIVPGEDDERKLRVSVTVAPEAPLGARELRAVTATGVSEPVIVNVDFLSQITEREPNNDTNHAQLVELPVAINGVIRESAESDFFRFKAQKAQRLIFDVYAFRSGSPLDSSLALLDTDGKELVRSEDVNGLDSLIDFTVAHDGEYFLQIRDFRYQGAKDFKYRIVAGELPCLDGIFPLGGQRGKSVEVSLRGRNLDALSKMKLKVEPTAPMGQQEIRARTAKGYSNPVLFDVGGLAEFTETEPNNSLTNANAANLPVVINGRINGEKDVDQFKFKVEKDQTFIFEVEASRFGSPLDAVLYLTDAKGKVIQQNDDAVGADARIEQRFGEAGEYVIKIRDLLERNGEDFAYRLVVRPPKPDFTVSFYPDTPRLYRGSYTAVSVEVQRQAGFDGAVEARLQNVPAGVTAEPLLVPPDSTVSPMIVLHASEVVPLGHHLIKLRQWRHWRTTREPRRSAGGKWPRGSRSFSDRAGQTAVHARTRHAQRVNRTGPIHGRRGCGSPLRRFPGRNSGDGGRIFLGQRTADQKCGTQTCNRTGNRRSCHAQLEGQTRLRNRDATDSV